MPAPRVHILAPDTATPSGGMLHLYRMADILGAAGWEAQVVHQARGFRLDWFPHRTRVAYAPDVAVGRGDWLVIPEYLLPKLAAVAPGVRKAVYVQNPYLMFMGWPLGNAAAAQPLAGDDVRAVLTVSEDAQRYLEFALGRAEGAERAGAPVLRHVLDADPLGLCGFVPPERKRQQVALMPRKNARDVEQVIGMLRSRGALDGWDVAVIDGVPLARAMTILQESAVFLSFGSPEGFGLPVAEAMLCGCVVIGYHGFGGREFFTAEHGFPIEAGDVLGFVRAAEGVLADSGAHAALCERAERFVRGRYNGERQRATVMEAWEEIVARG